MRAAAHGFSLTHLARQWEMHITSEVSACLPGALCKVISRAPVNIPDNYIWLLMLTICYFVIKTRGHAAQSGIAFMLQ